MSKKDEDDNIGYPRLITKPCRTLEIDVRNLLESAKIYAAKFAKSHDGNDRHMEGTYSRSCVLTCVLFLEALVYNVYIDFKVNDENNLPDNIREKYELDKKGFDRLSLEDKLYLIPYLCDDQKRYDRLYFERGSTKFQEIRELILIRNSFSHQRPRKRRLKIKKVASHEFEMNDVFRENFWPLTEIPKDFFIIGYKDAYQASTIITDAFRELNSFLEGKLTRGDWMSTERIEFDPDKK